MSNQGDTAPIRQGDQAGQSRTISTVFLDGIGKRSQDVIFRQKRFGIWEETTWNEFGSAVREIALGLISLGFESGETASILSNTRREWAFADLAIVTAGGISSGIYPTDAPGQVEYLLVDSNSVVVFVEDDEQLDKVLEVRVRLPKLRRIIVFDTEHLAGFADPMVIDLSVLRELGRSLHVEDPSLWRGRAVACRPANVAILVYTSGTTGRPKGAMLTHDNVTYAMRLLADHVLHLRSTDERMGYLPLCHVAERIGGLMTSLQSGAVINFVENPDAVVENIREIQPTVIFGVPRIWEKFYSLMQIRLGEATPLQRWAYRTALAVGERVGELRSASRRMPFWLLLAHQLAYWIVLRNLRAFIGLRRCRLLFSAAAPISVRLLQWYRALGIEVIELYGQTESAGILTANPAGRAKLGTVGPAVAGCEVRLSNEGEILARGRNVFAGYVNQPEATAATLADGWLRTGDIGEMDGDGYFRIKDRLKDIIITSGGKNITPSEIENELKFSPYISDAVVVGDRRPYLVCLIMIDHETVERYAQDHGIAFSDYSSLCRAPEIQTLMHGIVTEVNGHFARVEQIKKFRLIERKLSVENEELTPTMKLKRKLINEKYRDLIEEMYASAMRPIADAIAPVATD
ncbi:MAG: long-chain fatty acid--CoA ligase [Xanthobacteraceae bacterium]|nr:long-chain fatty acid--CoA ligase [Xanthobacteraceae bacterium]